MTDEQIKKIREQFDAAIKNATQTWRTPIIGEVKLCTRYFDPYQHVAMDILRAEDVIYAGTHRAKVIQFDANKDSAEIKFNDASLIPPTMWVPVRHLSHAYGGAVVNPQTHCPKCHIQWKEVVLARFSVWDCPSCGAKKEDHAR